MTKTELFLKLASPNSEGISRWVKKSEFVGEYSKLYFENGFSWGRKDSTLAKRFIIETDNSISSSNSIDRIRLAGFAENNSSQYIKLEIKNEIKSRRCVVLGTSNLEDAWF